jgi:hypothetical protein
MLQQPAPQSVRSACHIGHSERRDTEIWPSCAHANLHKHQKACSLLGSSKSPALCGVLRGATRKGISSLFSHPTTLSHAAEPVDARAAEIDNIGLHPCRPVGERSVETDAPLIAERHGKRVNWPASADLVAGGAYLYENYWRRDETWPSSLLESLHPSTGTFSRQ